LLVLLPALLVVVSVIVAVSFDVVAVAIFAVVLLVD